MRIIVKSLRWWAKRNGYALVSAEKWREKCNLANDGVNLRQGKIPNLQKQMQGMADALEGIRNILGVRQGVSVFKAVKKLRDCRNLDSVAPTVEDVLSAGIEDNDAEPCNCHQFFRNEHARGCALYEFKSALPPSPVESGGPSPSVEGERK